MFTVPTVQTVRLFEVYVTASPEVAVAVNGTVAPRFWLLSALNVIVCKARTVNV